MSARFFKILSGVLLAYLVVFSIVWVGFSAPFPRPPATFTYEGPLAAKDDDSGSADQWPEGKTADQFALDHINATNFNHWIDIRGPSKP